MIGKVFKSKIGQYSITISKKEGDALNLQNKEKILINGIEREKDNV